MAENQNKALSAEELATLVVKQGEQIAALQLALAERGGSEIKEAAKEVKPKLPETPVSYKGKEYKFIIPSFIINGEVFTAEQAAADQKVLALILNIKGQNIVKELV